MDSRSRRSHRYSHCRAYVYCYCNNDSYEHRNSRACTHGGPNCYSYQYAYTVSVANVDTNSRSNCHTLAYYFADEHPNGYSNRAPDCDQYTDAHDRT